MKNFIKNIVLFFGVLLGFNVLIYFFAVKNYYSEYRVYPSKEFSNFLLSDSHGLALSNHLEKIGIYNFSAGSDSYQDMEYKLKFLLENGYHIDTLYITVDHHTLGSYRESNNNSDRSNVYTTRTDYNSYYAYIINRYVLEFLPVFKSRVRDVFFEYCKSIIVKKSKSKEKNWIDLNDKQRKQSIENRYVTQFGSSKQSIILRETLLRIMNLCSMHDITLIGIKFPLVEAYLEKVDKHDYGADSLFQVNKHKVIDFSESFISKDECFLNQDHLNDKGGLWFAELWFQELRK